MARRPTVRYFASRGAYYCQIDRRQHRLADGPDDGPRGPTYLQALAAYTALLERGNLDHAGAGAKLHALIEAWFDGHAEALAPSSLRHRKSILSAFVGAFGARSVADLTPELLASFERSQRAPRARPMPCGGARGQSVRCQWGDSAVASFRKALNAILNWAVDSLLIPRNPIKHVPRPRERSRSRDCLVSDAMHAAIVAPPTRTRTARFLEALRSTGARPGELTHARGRDFDARLGAIVYYGDDRRRADEFRHKTAGTNRDRVIYLSGPTLEYVRTVAESDQAAYLFPNKDGAPYGESGVTKMFQSLRERVGMAALTAYSYRHTYATNWLLAGRSLPKLAEILGNTPATLLRHYAHLDGHRPALAEEVRAFQQATGTNGPV